jgi:hypothetical protein
MNFAADTPLPLAMTPATSENPSEEDSHEIPPWALVEVYCGPDFATPRGHVTRERVDTPSDTLTGGLVGRDAGAVGDGRGRIRRHRSGNRRRRGLAVENRHIFDARAGGVHVPVVLDDFQRRS